MRNALICLILLSGILTVSAQEADTAAVTFPDTVAVPAGKVIPMKGAFLTPLQERDSVLIADQLLYGFELKGVLEGTQLIFPELPKEQDYKLMYLSPWIVDTLKMSKAKKGEPRLLDIKGSVVITSFEEGLYELPQIALGRLSLEGVTDTLIFDPVRLDVRTMPVDTATFVPHDIKGQIRYPVTVGEVIPWIGLWWLTAVLVILAVCLVIMRRRRNDPSSAHHDPAHIVALRKLDQYRGSRLWAPDKQKAFYSGVTDTLREYMAQRYGISAMEMTTAEIFDHMKGVDAPEGLVREINDLFVRADFVKFAKYVASDDDNATVLPVAVRFVTETYQAEIETETDKNGGQE